MEEKTNTNQKPIKITIILPTNAYFISGIRDFTLNLIKNTTSFEEKWAFRFQSVVDELCNNAIEYGSDPEENITINFIHKKEEYIEIQVEDTGTGNNRINATELQKIIDEKKEPGYKFTGIRGRGLVKIVSEWTDELKIEDNEKGGLKISVRKYLKDARYNSGIKTNNILNFNTIKQ